MLEVDESEKPKLLHEETTGEIIGAAFEVHAQLGYGFLERVSSWIRMDQVQAPRLLIRVSSVFIRG
jgi:hypothetical protein